MMLGLDGYAACPNRGHCCVRANRLQYAPARVMNYGHILLDLLNPMDIIIDMNTKTTRLVGTNQKHGQDYNKSVVFEHIRLFGPISRADISARTLLVPQTVSNLVRNLIEGGLVVELQESGVARKRGAHPTQLAVNESALFTVGVQVQYSRIFAALVNLGGKIVRSAERHWNLPSDFETFVKGLVTMSEELVVGVDGIRSITELQGIGIGVPRLYGKMFGNLPAPSWPSQIVLKKYLEENVDCEVIVANNAHLAAVGEYWMGRGKVPATFLYVYLGDNVGGGLIVDGEEYVGVSGKAIELGHVQYMPGGISCYCGSKGCLDQYGSVNALRRRLSVARDAPLGEVLNTANEQQLTIIHEGMEALAASIISVLSVLDVSTCVIGGPHAKDLFSLLLIPLESKIREREYAVEVRCSNIDIHAGAIGAASTVFHDALWCKTSNLLKAES